MHVVDASPLSAEALARIDSYWRAANYLSVGQIYLMGNPPLRDPLLPEQVKPLLGHWGTASGCGRRCSSKQIRQI
jgi:xylulose-5-phosphate/fructose-6-phosphate phosphoketolase